MLLLWAVSVLAGSFLYAQSSMLEQHETGQARTAQGLRSYRIRLLPLASFPNLPPAVITQLEARQCLIPQTYEARQPENVLHGAFAAKGSNDWAMLCSHDGSTSLLVFFSGHEDHPYVLATLKDTDRMAAEEASVPLGSAWGISNVSPDEHGRMANLTSNGDFDHDAIRDEFIESSSTIHYFRNGSWLSFDNDR